MNIKSSYFKMKKDEFEAYLSSLKSQANSIHLLSDKYFYVPTIETTNDILHLNKKIYEFDSLMGSFSKFAKKQIIQSFLLEEIQSTNKIENIQSTKHDIFSVISSQASLNNKKVVSIANVYKQLLLSNGKKIVSCKDIRELYGEILAGSIAKDDLPDGLYFRKNAVFVNDGIKNSHMGVNGEENINYAMDEFLNLYNSKSETITKLILTHFMFESIHPFYDGNGRLGRFLFSNELLLETGSYFAFLISSALAHQKSKYYQAFKKADDKYEFGCLDAYFETILSILNKEIDSSIEKLSAFKGEINNYSSSVKMSKNEAAIHRLISEASILSDFGISNEEILQETGISKRTLLYSLKKIRNNEKMIDTKFGKFTYHKFEL